MLLLDKVKSLELDLFVARSASSKLGFGNHFNVNTNSNARVASKKFWMQKTQTN